MSAAPSYAGDTPDTLPPLSTADIRVAGARLRQASARFPGARRVADALAAGFDLLREKNASERSGIISCIANARGFSPALLEQSIEALLAPFSAASLQSVVERAAPRERVGGFFMPANVPGAGMHELVAGLISGAGALVKTSVREPHFFAWFARILKKIDPEAGSMIEMVSFGREHQDLTAAMKQACDFIVILGEDVSISSMAGGPRLFGYGSRASGALVSFGSPADIPAVAAAMARDITLFEQQGCLSPNHIFVSGCSGTIAGEFAHSIAHALARLAAQLPPATLSFNTAAAIRRIRESARWRNLGGRGVEIMEGPLLSWTVVFDPAARFTMSPGYRTVYVGSVQDCAELDARLAPVAGRLEAFAIAASPAQRTAWVNSAARAGANYICRPGEMQSPPVLWSHGGGEFLDFITGAR